MKLWDKEQVTYYFENGGEEPPAEWQPPPCVPLTPVSRRATLRAGAPPHPAPPCSAAGLAAPSRSSTTHRSRVSAGSEAFCAAAPPLNVPSGHPAPLNVPLAPRNPRAPPALVTQVDDATFKKWFPKWKRPASNPKFRLVCFHNAGSAESNYTGRGLRMPNDNPCVGNRPSTPQGHLGHPTRAAQRPGPCLRAPLPPQPHDGSPHDGNKNICTKKAIRPSHCDRERRGAQTSTMPPSPMSHAVIPLCAPLSCNPALSFPREK
eukprot:scaffold27304_cov90-Isochrysis_galbana.AAC.1